MKYRRVWFFGGDKKENDIDDYITSYVAENGKVMAVKHSFMCWSTRWYEVEGKSFFTLKDAKAFVESL